jgi:hypothetical protein
MIESFSNPYSALNEKDCGFYQLDMITWLLQYRFGSCTVGV